MAWRQRLPAEPQEILSSDQGAGQVDVLVQAVRASCRVAQERHQQE